MYIGNRATLNHAGVCASYMSAWKYLLKLTEEHNYQQVIRTGHWQWVYDNLNLQQRVRHEREDRRSTMLNITSRLAVRVKNLPPWEVDWSDTSSQQPWQHLQVSDFMPTEQDAKELRKRAVVYMMRFLTEQFPALSHLAKSVPDQESVHPIAADEIVPMTVLLKDEKYIAETIDILSTLIEDANLNGGPQTIVGDQLTCKNIRSSKMWRQPEVNPKDKLGWTCESPGDFHFLWECLRVVYSTFWGTQSLIGSLCNLREITWRHQVDKAVKVFNVGDEFLMHAFKSHLTAAVIKDLKVKSPSDEIQLTNNSLKEASEKLVTNLLMPTSCTDQVHHFHRRFMHTAFLYIDLREAIRWENGPHIIQYWKLWLPRFLGTGKTNYASEAVHLISNIQAIFPKHITYIICNNRTVNIQGRPGRGKPIDQLMEHYNLIFKQTVRSAGANLTVKHIKDVSLSVLFLMEAAAKTNQAFSVPVRSTAHTVASADKDTLKMAEHLIEKNITTPDSERMTPQFIDPTDTGMMKLSSKWLKDTLDRTSTEITDLDEVEDDNLDINDAEYSLADIL